MAKPKRLYRSEKDRMIGGVCGGLADYLETDPTLVRIVFVVLAFAWGASIWLYLLLWLIIPSESSSVQMTDAAIRENIEDVKQTTKKAADVAAGSAEKAADKVKSKFKK